MEADREEQPSAKWVNTPTLKKYVTGMFYKIIPKAEYAVSLRFPRINCLLLDTIHGISLVCAGVCLYELAE